MNGALSKLRVKHDEDNRFISKSIGLARPLSEYAAARRSHRIAPESEILAVAEELAATTLAGLAPATTGDSTDIVQTLKRWFTDPSVRLGARELSEKTLDDARPLIENRIAGRETLEFTILGFPHKMPNPLYTRSTSVDLAEIVSIVKMTRLMERVSALLPGGARLRILAENTVFHTMSDISFEEQQGYFNDLACWTRKIDRGGKLLVDDIAWHHTRELDELWPRVTEEFERRYAEGDPEMAAMIEAVMPTNFNTLWYRDLSEEILLKYFDPSCEDPALERLREKKYARALKESFFYLAYHQARYRLGFMEQAFPQTIRMTVSPKPGSIGINMLNESTKILPYYGYVVRDGANFSVQYVVDVPEKARAVYLEGNYAFPMFFEL